MRRLLLALTLLLATCSAPRPYTYVDHREMEDRPGLFTGPAGEFTLYRR